MKVPSSSFLAVSLTFSHLLPQEASALSSRAISPGDFNGGKDAAAAAAAAAPRKSNNNSNSRSRIKRKAPGAPLVDSSLLRYISKQQKETQSQFQLADDDDGTAGCNSNDSAYMQALAVALSSSPSDTNNDTTITTTNAIKQQIVARSSTGAATAATTSTSTMSLNAAATSPVVGEDISQWRMRQFNHHAIAQRLMALGADADEAKAAGQAVQRYCLVRTARRRIRIFLKERDSLWRKTAITTSSSSISSNSGVLDMDQQLPIKDTAAAAATASMQSSSTTTATVKPVPTYGLDDTLQVMQDHGLTGKDISTILTHSPSLALMMPTTSFLEQGAAAAADSTDRTGETLEETLERSFHGLLMNTLGLRKYDARKVLRTCPGLLSVRGSKSAEQVVAMMTKLGVAENAVAREKTALPTLLSRSPAGLFRLVSFLCSSSIRMPIDQVGPLLRRKESRELMDAVIPIPSSSSSLSDSQAAADFRLENGVLSDDDPIAEAAFWTKSREERRQNIEELYRNMTETAFALREEIGTEDLTRVISAYPSVLLLDAKRQILPVAEYLMDELGIVKDDLARVLQLYPTLLGLDIADMEVVVGYLLALGVDEDDLPSMFRAFPALLTMTPQDMQPVVDFLRSIDITDVGAFVTRLPPVLGYSVEKELKPKWEFLKTVCMFANFEITKFPAYFSYPLGRVIRARYEYLSYKRISRQLIPVDSVLRYGDKDFATKVARDDDKGEEFLAFCKARSKILRGEKPSKNNNNKGKRKQQASRQPTDDASE